MAYSVLLIDDSRTMRDVVAMTFRQTEFALHTAATAMEGLEVAKTLVPSLILVDVRLPGLDGYEVCRRLKADPATHGCPVLLFIGAHVPPDKPRSLEVGALGFFTKPFDTQDLLDQAGMICKAARPRPAIKAAPSPVQASATAIKPVSFAPAAPSPAPIPVAPSPAPKPAPAWDAPAAEQLISTAHVLRQAKAPVPEEAVFEDDIDTLDAAPSLSTLGASVPVELSAAESAMLLEEDEEAEAAPAPAAHAAPVASAPMPAVLDDSGLTEEERATLMSLQGLAPAPKPAAPHPAAPRAEEAPDFYGFSSVESKPPHSVAPAPAPVVPEIDEIPFAEEEPEPAPAPRASVAPTVPPALPDEEIIDVQDIEFELDIEPMDVSGAPASEPEPIASAASEPPFVTFEEELSLAEEGEGAPIPVFIPKEESPSVVPAAPAHAVVEPRPEPVLKAVPREPIEPAAHEDYEIDLEEPKPRAETPALPDADRILELFRKAIREETAAHSASESTLRVIVREELAALAAPAPDAAALAEAVRQAVNAEVKDIVGRTLREVMNFSVEKMERMLEAAKSAPVISAPAAPAAVAAPGLGAAELAALFDAKLAGLAASLPAPVAPIPVIPAPPSPDAIAQAVQTRLEGTLAALRTALRDQTVQSAGLGEEIHTWIQTALQDIPSAEEWRALTAGQAPAASGVSADLAATIRSAIRAEIGQMVGQQAEAVAWEVVPPLAERLIQKQLDGGALKRG